ncbi:MAG: ATP-dependent Clp protease ATP-binding subunit [Chitinophagales bacterium]
MIPHSTILKRAIQIATALAKENKNETFGPPHLMQALLNDDIGLSTELATNGIDIYYLREWAEVRIEDYPKSTMIGETIAADKDVAKVFEVAEMIKLKLNDSQITPLAIFIALIRPGVGFSKDQIQTLGINENTLLTLAVENAEMDKSLASISDNKAPKSKGKSEYIGKYCINRIELAANGKIDPVVGRDEELRELSIILKRRQKPNAILLGEPGVGKTAIMDAYTTYCYKNEEDTTKIFEIDLGALFAGASYKGEIEDRLKGIIKEVKQYDDVVLFIDEIHTLLDPASGAGGAMNILKPELARGEITVVGATTLSEYREFIEPDEAIVRRFESLKVEEPNDEKALLMLNAVIPTYSNHHKVEVDEGALEQAILLTRRYLKERRLPDAAIDLIDRTMASIRVSKDKGPEIINEIKIALNVEEGAISTRKGITQMKERISPIAWMSLDEQINSVFENEDKGHLNDLLDILLSKVGDKNNNVRSEDIASIVAMRTGIPLGKIQSSEKEKLLSLEANICNRVIGQDHGVKVVSDAILESRSGLKRKGLPIGSFFFLGPTGTGKTELAKALAESVFNDKDALIRFDMSEFKEEHSAALLYGAPPGYIGYKEGGLLVNKIRQKPYAVVLFDEIEKAHASVFDIFLQILDEGKLHDKLGKEGDFSNAIVLFTSNIGSEFIIKSFADKVIPKSNQLMEIMANHFRPEFLGRLTEIIPFSPITKEHIVKIFNLQMKELHTNLGDQEIKLELSDKATEELAYEGFNPKYGARPLRGVIRLRLTKPLSRKIISGEIVPGDNILVDWDEEKKEIIWVNKPKDSLTEEINSK